MNDPQLFSRAVAPIWGADSPENLMKRIRAVLQGRDFPMAMLAAYDAARGGDLPGPPGTLELPQAAIAKVFGEQFVAPIVEIQCTASRLIPDVMRLSQGTSQNAAATAPPQASDPAGIIASIALGVALHEQRHLPDWLTEALIELWRKNVEELTEHFEKMSFAEMTSGLATAGAC
jgi:hypothetical protein